MKKLSVILLVAVCLMFAGMAEAAKPKKRTRNANRIGPYGALLIGQSRFAEDQAWREQGMVDFFVDREDPTRNVTSSSETENIGFQATFGYRFHRYFAAEIALIQLGELSSTMRGEVDQGEGFIPVTLKDSFNVSGPMVSAIGILPIGKKAEAYVRAGYLFASAKRELAARVDGQNGGANGVDGDSETPVFGLGLAYHFNQIYSVRVEYQDIDGVGEESRSGEEDLSIIGVGFQVRF